MPNGIMVVPAQPYRYDITFNDPDFEEHTSYPLIQGVWDEWKKDWQRHADAWVGSSTAATTPEIVTSVIASLQASFSSTPVYTTAESELQWLCYWDAGRYSLRMDVNTARPDNTHSMQWTFTLSAEEAARLRQNGVLTVMQTIGRPLPYAFSWVDAKYE